MNFENVNKKYVEEALKIAIEEYEAECVACPQLVKKDFSRSIEALLEELFEKGQGKVAIENNEVIGYLAFKGPWEGFHGKSKGVFSPLGGSGIRGSNRGKLISRLFEEVGNELINENICTYAVSRYAHDDEVARSFILNGFGIRCSDAVVKLSDRNILTGSEEKIICEELFGEEKQIFELKKGMARHMSRAPIFFPTNLTNYFEKSNNVNSRLFVAKDNGKIVGYMKLDTQGENFITEFENMRSLGSSFMSESYRGKKTAQALLEYICNTCQQEGVAYLGVDFETMNPTALRFWNKYFSSYTYSYFRRVDERIVGYEKYMKNFFE